VGKKLAQLFGSEDHGVKLIGNAKKFMVKNAGNWGIEKITFLPDLPDRFI